MGQRILVLIFSLTALLSASAVNALGLGEISLQSGLNQPLKAEIKLLQVRDLSEAEILVGLGTPEDFERIGIDRPYFLTDIKFEVDLDSVSGPVIYVQSRKAVREPYLNFILQAQWPSGKLLREYTLLLDLPVFADSQAAPVQGVQTTTSFSADPAPAPSVTQASTQQASDAAYNPRSSYAPEGSFNSERPSSSGRASSPAPRLAGADEYAVGSGDTLWEISAAVRPDRGVSIQQTMLAIQRLNPEAFINNNINLLKKGQILRIPDRDDIAETTRREAVQEVAVQNGEWTGRDYDYGSSDVQLEGSRSYAANTSEPTSREGRLTLASPEDVADSYEGRGSGSGGNSQAALENELAITLEQLDKSKRENSDLRSKVAALEEQIKTAERLVEVSSEEMRALELSAQKNAEEREAAQENTVDETIEDAIADESAESFATDGSAESEVDEADSSTEIAETGGEETSEAESAVAAEESKAVEKPKPQPAVQPVYQKTIVDHILDNIIYIGIGLLVLVVGIFLFIRSRGDDGFDDEDFMTDTSFEESQSDFDVESALAEEEGMDLFEEAAEAEETEVEEEELISEAQTEDVVAEADIYIAYGKYDQAEDILLKSLESDPDNKDARLKLVEVYASQQQGDKFDHHFAILHELGDDAVISRAEQLRSGIDGLGDFSTAAEGGESTLDETLDETDDGLDFSLDLDADDNSELDTELSGDDGDLSLDLDVGEDSSVDLSLDDELELDIDLDESPAADTDLDGDLDFDLGDFDIDVEDDAETTSSESQEADTQDDELSLDFDLGDDELATDDLAIDLDSGEDLTVDIDIDGDETLIEDDISEDVEPIDFDLAADDTEVGSTPAVSDEDLNDLEFELGSEPELASDNEDDLDGDFDLAFDAEEESNDEFELALSDEEVEDLDEVPELGLGDVSEDDLEPIVGSGSEDLTLITPAITEEDLAGNDELDLDSDLDLSALDQELDALTGADDLGSVEDLEGDLELEGELDVDADISADLEPVEADISEDKTEIRGESEPQIPVEIEEGDALAPVLSLDDELTSAEVEPEPERVVPKMEEPVVDFDGLDIDDEPAVEDNSETDMGEDTMFDQAVNEVPESDMEFDLPEIDPEAIDDDTDLGFLSDSDETATKLDLARAYIDMGDAEGAKDIIAEIVKEGNDQQRKEAESLLGKLS